jgi:hypothetical protein
MDTSLEGRSCQSEMAGPQRLLTPQAQDEADRQAAHVVWRWLRGKLDRSGALARTRDLTDWHNFIGSHLPDAQPTEILNDLSTHRNGVDPTVRARLLSALLAVEDEPRPRYLGALDSREFARASYHLTWLIKHVLVEGMPAIVAGPQKGNKTNLLIDLCVSLGTATPFLNNPRFEVPTRKRVLFLSGESGDASIQSHASKIAESRGLSLEEVDAIWASRLPSLSDPEAMSLLADLIVDEAIKVVIIDPIYLCLGDAGGEASNLFRVGSALKQVEQTVKDAGATLIFAHHVKKPGLTDPYAEPPQLTDLAFAGFAEFARQWILIGRRESWNPESTIQKHWLSVGSSAFRGADFELDVDTGAEDEFFCGWDWKPSMVRRGAAIAAHKNEAAQLDEDRRQADRLDLAKLMIQGLRRLDGRGTANALRTATGLGDSRVRQGIAILVDMGHARLGDIRVKTGTNQRIVQGVELIDGPDLFEVPTEAPEGLKF